MLENIMNTFSLKGKIMVITGGTNGIGKGLVEYFFEQGVTVIALGSKDETVNKLKEEYLSKGIEIDARVLDVRKVKDIAPLFDEVVKDYGRIDILINCAGMGHPIKAIEVSEKDWDDMMDLNLKGAFFCAQAAGKHMLKEKYGRIINISSQISVVANDSEVVYCASKGGMNQMTKVLALEWGKDGVIVSAVAPTFTYTPGTAERLDNKEFKEAVLSKIPRGRLGNLNDVGSACHFLASDSADMVNGHVLMIDGGWTIV